MTPLTNQQSFTLCQVGKYLWSGKKKFSCHSPWPVFDKVNLRHTRCNFMYCIAWCVRFHKGMHSDADDRMYGLFNSIFTATRIKAHYRAALRCFFASRRGRRWSRERWRASHAEQTLFKNGVTTVQTEKLLQKSDPGSQEKRGGSFAVLSGLH